MRRLLLVLVVVCGIAATTAGCGSGGDSRPRPRAAETVTVPAVVGLPRSKAACVLARAGLRWRGGGERRAQRRPPVPCGPTGVTIAPDPTVRRQRPRAGRPVARGGVIVLEDDCTLLRFDARGAACA
jgi:hypothetical protein